MAIIGRLNEHCMPLFCNITWKPSQDPMSDTCQLEPSTLLVSAAAIDLYGQNIMIHNYSIWKHYTEPDIGASHTC